MTSAHLAQLVRLAEARRIRSLSDLDALLAEDRRLAAQARNLARALAEERGRAEGVPFQARALREAWAERQSKEIERRRAELAVAIGIARSSATKDLGKHLALERLAERSVREMVQMRAQRVDREAPMPPVSEEATRPAGRSR